jgi:hypothetical protein
LSADEPALSRGGVEDGAVVDGTVEGRDGFDGVESVGEEGDMVVEDGGDGGGGDGAGSVGGEDGGSKGGGGDGIGTLPRKEVGRYAGEVGSHGEMSCCGRMDHRQTASLAAPPKGGMRGVVVQVPVIV